MASAANRVFGVAELLEKILLEAEATDILLLQRVCRFWQATVQGSTPLKQAIFLTRIHGSGLEIRRRK